MTTVTLEKSERFPISAQATGRSYDIALGRPLPLRATGETPTDCPIIFVLDSSLTFGTSMERSSMYAAMGALQSAVIVGVGYPGDIHAALTERTIDFTPETPAGSHPELAPLIGTKFGGADEFLSFLTDELAPAVRARVPEASATRRVLHGFSLGGLFSAYALMKRPEAFETFSIISPSLWWNDFAVLKLRPGFVRRLAETKARPRVLVGVGALEQEDVKATLPGMDLEKMRERSRTSRMVDAAQEFAADLATLPLSEVKFQSFEGEDHPGALTAGTGRAISFALRP